MICGYSGEIRSALCTLKDDEGYTVIWGYEEGGLYTYGGEFGYFCACMVLDWLACTIFTDSPFFEDLYWKAGDGSNTRASPLSTLGGSQGAEIRMDGQVDYCDTPR